MNPIYKFTLSGGGDTITARPVYKDDIAIEYALEQGQQFYRGKFSGKLTFEGPDYTFIVNKPFDTQFGLTISISYDRGQTWTEYWTGQFWKTDCEFNADDKTVIVTPTVQDRYAAVLEGMDKEFNLIDLAPEIRKVRIDKRPMIQIYVPGQTVVGCFLSGMWWEQECESVTNTSQLINTYHFHLNKTRRILDVTQSGSPNLPIAAVSDALANGFFNATAGGYTFRVTTPPGSTYRLYEIIRVSDNTVLWVYNTNTVAPTVPYSVTLNPMSGSGATGTVTLYVHDISVYARLVTDVDDGQTVLLPDNDIVPNNRNYSRVIGYNNPDTIVLSSLFSPTPTKWGYYSEDKYYFNPADSPYSGITEAFPVARAAWDRVSLWFAPTIYEQPTEEAYRKEIELKNAYPLWSVISVILGKIAPGIAHGNSTTYSKFLYGTNPITSIRQHLFLTPKSNIVTSGYDQPAQKAPITLKMVLDMLRDCFRCYWYIDNEGRFRVEHISWFMRGGTYTDNPVVGINLREQIVTRNGKPWSFARNQYTYDKPEMAGRYQFAWADDVTELFEGYPIDINSKYVNPENIEQIDISQITTDVDYILLNPGEISKDGFVLLSATWIGYYKLPYINFKPNTTGQILQNPWVSFVYLQKYYMYDMPAWNVSINGVPQVVQGTKKLKMQTIKFPLMIEPDFTKLVKTELGDGTIQKISVNLSSRNANATLKYDTE